MQNIEEINLVSEKTEEKPNYSLENKLTWMDVYFNGEGQVLIVGVVDNNYIYCASLTNSDDRELNRSIFDYISRGKIRKVSHLSQALKVAGLDYGKVKRWVKISLKRKPEDPMYFVTPFDGNYGSAQVENNGKFFAKDISYYLTRVRAKCAFREADGAYEKVLDYYLSVLKDDNGDALYYQRIKNLINIIESEAYLYGSENPEIRRKYIELRELSEKLYNRYMSAVR